MTVGRYPWAYITASTVTATVNLLCTGGDIAAALDVALRCRWTPVSGLRARPVAMARPRRITRRGRRAAAGGGVARTSRGSRSARRRHRSPSARLRKPEVVWARPSLSTCALRRPEAAVSARRFRSTSGPSSTTRHRPTSRTWTWLPTTSHCRRRPT